MSWQINVWKWSINGLIDKKSFKKQKKNREKLFLKKKLLSIMHKTKKAIKEKSRERYKNLSQEEKDKIKKYQRKDYQELIQYKN